MPAPPFPNSPSPNWYRQAQWNGINSKRNAVHYVGDDVVLDLAWATPNYNTFIRQADFERGTNGNTITIGPSEQSYSGWEIVNGTPTYDSTRVAHGNFSARFSGSGFLEWDQGSHIPTDYYLRWYFYATANPAGGSNIFQDNPDGGGNTINLQITSTGLVAIVVGAAFNSAASIALNQWIRLEMHIKHSATVGQVTARLFNSPESSTPTEEWATTADRNTGTGPNNLSFGRIAGSWTADISFDEIIGVAPSWVGPYSATPPAIVNPVTYTVRNFYGETVVTGTFEEGHETFILDAPAGGWRPGWYRIYLTGSQSNADFANSYGATNFCVVRSDSHFTAMPAGNTSAGNTSGNDYVLKGVMGLGTSRLDITNANAPTTGANTLADAEADAAISATYWSNNGIPDSARPERTMWCAFGPTSDVRQIAGQAGGLWGSIYPATESLDGANVFVTVAAGTLANTDKVTVHYPNSTTLAETWDNLDDGTEAQTVINAGSTIIKFFAQGAARGQATAQTAIGNAYRTGIALVVSTLYPLGVTRFEGPANEPALTAETAHAMRMFWGAVHAGNANAKAIGPCSVNILNLSGWTAFLDGGGGNWCDELSFHAYNSIENGDSNSGKYTIQAFLDLLDSYGLRGKTLWQTESTQATIIPYGVYHPRRGKKLVMDLLLLEQKGIPRERNNAWYDVSNGFWDFPAWLANIDGSVEAQTVLGRVLAEETWGKPFIAPLDFGTPVANSIFLGNLYRGSAGSTIALMTPSFIDGASVTLSVWGTSGPVNVVDGFGNVTSVSPSQGRVQIGLTEIPSYLELPVGATATVYRVNDWPLIGPGTSSASSASTKEIDGVSYPVIADDGYVTNYATGAGIAPTTWATPPSVTRLLWSSARTIERVIVWCGPSWQNSGTLITFDVQTTTDGTNWTTRRTISKPALSYFAFGTDFTNVGCFLETYWDEQWIFDIKLPAPVTCTGVRLNVTAASYGGEPLSADSSDFGQGNPAQAYRIQEIGTFVEPTRVLTPVLSLGRGAA